MEYLKRKTIYSDPSMRLENITTNDAHPLGRYRTTSMLCCTFTRPFNEIWNKFGLPSVSELIDANFGDAPLGAGWKCIVHFLAINDDSTEHHYSSSLYIVSDQNLPIVLCTYWNVFISLTLPPRFKPKIYKLFGQTGKLW